jgi:YfiH family protein
MSAAAPTNDGDAIGLALPGGGRALFTTRAAGNLSLSAGDRHEQGLAARERLCAALGLSWLCASPQVHGTDVRLVSAQTHSGGQPVGEPADGHATALRGIGVMVLAADCMPVVLGAPGAVAAVHAGWRGLAAGVLEHGVQALRELAPEGEAGAVIGPCAGSCCYEVGEEVLSALGLPGHPQGSAKAMLDLRAVARERLTKAGIENVLDIDRCTICDERMFSHRRQGAAAGRQAAIAWLP